MMTSTKKTRLYSPLMLATCVAVFISSAPSMSAAFGLSSPNMSHKSQAFRAQFTTSEKSLIHTWPHINQVPAHNNSLQFTSSNYFANPEPLINTLHGTSQLQLLTTTSTNLTLLHVQLQMTYPPQKKEPHINLDGSLVGVALGHWLVSISAVDRWWGPAWQSPLLISNNARPIPAISLDRIKATAPTTPGFRWIGPWSINTFLGRLESERVISNPLFWGFRMSAMPINGLEIGIGRTALFGGSNRDVDSSVFYNVITGQDNANDQPGNQLGSIDISYRFNSKKNQTNQGHELYIEIAGEDEAGGAPSKKFSTVGYTGFIQGLWHYLLEFSDTTAGSFGETKLNNITYKHHIYRTGYTHHGQTIGSPLGGDTQSMTLGLWQDQHFQSTGAWISKKTFAVDQDVIQLNFWTEQHCGGFRCTLSLDTFNQPMKDQRIDPQGKKFAISAGIQWFFKKPTDY